jgi:hypothetical protein
MALTSFEKKNAWRSSETIVLATTHNAGEQHRHQIGRGGIDVLSEAIFLEACAQLLETLSLGLFHSFSLLRVKPAAPRRDAHEDCVGGGGELVAVHSGPSVLRWLAERQT